MGVSARLAALTLAVVCGCSAAAHAADNLKVTIGQKGFWNSTFIEFAEQQGFFRDENLSVEAIFTDGGATTMQPVIAGSVDLGLTNGTLGVISAYVKGAPIRIFAAESTGASDAFWYARADSGIKTLKDAKGKTISFSSPGSSTNLILLALLAQYKVDAKPLPTGGATATMTQVMTGQVDVGWSVPPLALADVEAGKLVIVARGSEVESLRDETVRVNIAHVDALKTKRDAIVRFTRAYKRAIDWAYSDPRAIDIFAETMKVARPVAQRAVDEFYPKTMFQMGEVRGLDKSLREAYETKRIPSPMTPDQVSGMLDIVAER
jgi:NitT/TauT family transport system substrate-binding protein